MHPSFALEISCMYILYHLPFSQHSRRVVSLMLEAALECEFRTVDLMRGEHHSAEYLEINPNHQVPTLLDGGIKIHESNAILRYLCLKHGLDDWYPTDLPARARTEQWLDWNQCRLSPAVIDIVLNRVFLKEHGDPQAIARGEDRLRELMPILEAGLEDSAFIASNRPTIADLSLASNVFQLSLADMEPAEANVQRWYARMKELEGFQRSLPPAR